MIVKLYELDHLYVMGVLKDHFTRSTTTDIVISGYTIRVKVITLISDIVISGYTI